MACSRMPKCTRVICCQIARVLKGQTRFRRRRKVGRSADEPGIALRNGVQHFARGVAARKALYVGRKDWQIDVPSLGKLTLLHAVELISKIGILATVLGQQFEPMLAKLPAALADAFSQMLAHSVRDKELGVLRPTVMPRATAPSIGPGSQRCWPDGRPNSRPSRLPTSSREWPGQ
jgi:hypothetical protein